jgi:hypothetical protein
MRPAVGCLVEDAIAGLVQAGVIQSDAVFPVQFFNARRARPMPEEALLIAVLEDAIDCLCKHRFAQDTRGRRLFHEEREWFMSADRNRLFAFERICEVLGLEADCVRSAVLSTAYAARSMRSCGRAADRDRSLPPMPIRLVR